MTEMNAELRNRLVTGRKRDGVDLFSVQKVPVWIPALAWGRHRSLLIQLGFLFTFLRRIVSTPIDGDRRCKAGTQPKRVTRSS